MHPRATLSTTNPTQAVQDQTQTSTVGKQAANHISHDTAQTDVICIYITIYKWYGSIGDNVGGV